MRSTKNIKTRKEEEQNDVLQEFDLSNIPDSFQFSNAKVEKRFSFFKFWIFICCVIIGVCTGIGVSYLFLHFC